MIGYTNDIIESKNRGIRQQGWLFGEKFNRIGSPFVWIDGEQLEGLDDISATVRILQYLSMSGEIYDTPAAIRTDDHDAVLEDLTGRLESLVRYFAGFADPKDLEFDSYIQSTASVKTQDYCAIRTWCGDLSDGCRQMDLGPGLGANMLYSVFHLKARYMAVDAFPPSYDVQRRFIRGALDHENLFLDTIDCETFGLSAEQIEDRIADPRYTALCTPSWHLPLCKDESIDIVTATWVLNEVNSAGIIWLLYHASRMLREGGYFYIRDSHRLKPMRHDLNYDGALLEIGFEPVAELDIVNRVDMHGIPRVYRKVKGFNLDFHGLYDKFFSRFSVTSHGGQYNQPGSDIEEKNE